MHTVELYRTCHRGRQIGKASSSSGWLDGGSAGFAGLENILAFRDVSLSAAEQLEQVVAGLRQVRWEGSPCHLNCDSF